MTFELQNVGSGVSGYGFVYSRPEIRELSLRPFELFADGPELGSLRARLSELRISVLEGRAGRQKLRCWGVYFKVWNFSFENRAYIWFRVPDALHEGCLRSFD